MWQGSLLILLKAVPRQVWGEPWRMSLTGSHVRLSWLILDQNAASNHKFKQLVKDKVVVFGPLFHQDGSTHLKALYTGRYQQTKEQGVKRSAQRMARPRPTPPLGSTQNMAREEMRLKSSVQVQTGHRQRRIKRRHRVQKEEREWLNKSQQHHSLRLRISLFVALIQSCGLKHKSNLPIPPSWEEDSLSGFWLMQYDAICYYFSLHTAGCRVGSCGCP